MPIRKLPRTNDERVIALRVIKDRLDNTPVTNQPFREATILQLTAFFPLYTDLLRDQRLSKAGQTSATGGVRQLRKAARTWVNHGYTSIVNATVRGTFNRSVLGYYGLPQRAKGAPKMQSETDILSAADQLLSGETARVAAGGEPIAFPSVAEIMVHANAFRSANLAQGTLKVTFADAQKAIAKANVEADRLILRLWNEIETAFDAGNAPSMRRKSREWGVIYVPGRKEAPTAETNSAMGIISDKATGKALRKVIVKVMDTEIRVKSNARGRYALPLLQAGDYVLQLQLKGYTAVEQTITVVEDEMTVRNIQLAEKESAAGK